MKRNVVYCRYWNIYPLIFKWMIRQINLFLLKILKFLIDDINIKYKET